MTADTVGGVWTYALELACALAAHEVNVALATMGARLSPEQWAQARALPNLEIYESDFKLEWMTDPWQDVQQAGDWLLQLEQTLQPDLIHLNGFAHGALPWSAPVLVVGHSCVLSWWQAVKSAAAPGEWNCYRDEVRRGITAADFVVAPTQAMLAEFDRLYGPLPASHTIYNGRDAVNFSPAAKMPFILAAGRLWDDAKNITALNAVATRLSWPVRLAGDDCHPDGNRVPHADVELLGKLSETEIAAYMAQAAIYALPARYEPFGLSVLEAALCGCTLVLGDIPTLREVWGEAAVFVAPADDDNLQRTLAALIDDEKRRTHIGALARERALQFSIKRMAQEYFDLYRMMTSEIVSPQLIA